MGEKIMKKYFVLIVTILALFVSCSKKAGSVTDPNEKEETNIKGFWMWGSTLSDQGTDIVVQKLADNFAKDVFLLVKGIAGTKTSATILKDFISKAHTKDIKIHLWYVVNSDDKFFSTHPDASIYHCPKPSIGYPDPYPMNDGRINPLYPGYKQYVLDNIRYFLTNFDCDGIHLDYIRYSHFVYSFDKYHLQKADSLGCNTERLLNFFVNNYDYYAYNEGFVDLFSSGDTDVVKWVELRKNVVYDYISSVKDLINQIKPDILFSASFMPEGATDPTWADSYYSQNYTLNSSLLDLIIPMSYFKDYGKNTDWPKTVAEKAIDLVDSSCKIAPGLQCYNGVTAKQLEEQIVSANEAGLFDMVIFRYGAASEEQWAVIKEYFKDTDENEK